MNISIQEYINGVKNGTINPKDIINGYINKNKNQTSPFERLHTDYVSDKIDDLTSKDLCGATIGISDNILTKGYISSCGSKIMEKYIAPYSATVFEKLESKGGLMIGKIKMSEFGLATSNKNFEQEGNEEIVAGSAAGFAVTNDYCMACLTTDNCGELRISAAANDVIGIKPTYGRISRYGVVAGTSSMASLGVISKNIEEAEILIRSISGWDSRDSQSQKKADEWNEVKYKNNKGNLQIAIPKDILHTDTNFGKLISDLKAKGAKITEIDIDHRDSFLAVYQILAAAEISSNLSRFDGIRFGLQDDTHKYANIDDYYQEIRAKSFGDEVQKQILFGTFVLSADNYNKYYLKAKALRNKIKKQFEEIFTNFDIVLTPTISNSDNKSGSKNFADKMNTFKYTVAANLVGLPALSMPIQTDNGSKFSIQIIGNLREENKLFEISKSLE